MFKRLFIHATALSAVVVCLSPAQAEMATKEMLTNTCVACHGNDGVSAGPAIPSLSGMTRNYFATAMLAYKYDDDPEGLDKAMTELEQDKRFEDAEMFARTSTIMGRIAKGYTLEEIKLMADVFADGEPSIVKQSYNRSKVGIGAELHEEYCDKCHADGGLSPEDDVGLLAGQWTPYLEFTLADYLEGRRESPKKMKTKLKEMHETHGMAGVHNLLHYYASVKK